MSQRKLSNVSAEEMASAHGTLEDLFAFYKEELGITSDGLVTFATNCHLIDKRLTTKDIPLIFSKCVLAKKKALKWGQFQEAVRNMAVKKGQTYQELVQDALGKTLTGGETDSVEIDEGMQSVAKQFTHNQDGTPLVPDSFDILKVLGTGSYGKVQLVKKKDTGTLHAMKSLKKGDLWKMKQMPHTQTECKVAMGLRHPCLVNLTYAFQTPVKLYLILDLMDGGEMFYWLRKAKPNFFNPARATLYAAECLLGIEFLHSHNVIYRDLKPENVMIDGGGHARLTDFGLAKEEVSGNVPGDAGLTKSLVGTPEYNAPEQLTGGKNGGQHGKAVDWWSLGMLMYEMTVGQPAYSVSNNNMNQLMKMIKTKPIRYPSKMTTQSAYKEVKAFIDALAIKDPLKRLGSRGGAAEIKQHALFANIDFDKVLNREYTPELVPPVRKFDDDVTNFDTYFTDMRARDSFAENPSGFQGWDFDLEPEIHDATAAEGGK